MAESAEFDFNIRDKVRIVELDVKGRILAVFTDDSGHSYKVRYFDNCTPYETYFYAEELECLTTST